MFVELPVRKGMGLAVATRLPTSTGAQSKGCASPLNKVGGGSGRVGGQLCSTRKLRDHVLSVFVPIALEAAVPKLRAEASQCAAEHTQCCGMV